MCYEPNLCQILNIQITVSSFRILYCCFSCTTYWSKSTCLLVLSGTVWSLDSCAKFHNQHCNWSNRLPYLKRKGKLIYMELKFKSNSADNYIFYCTWIMIRNLVLRYKIKYELFNDSWFLNYLVAFLIFILAS